MASIIKRRRGNGSFLPSLRSSFSELFDMDRFFDDPFLETSWRSFPYSRVPATNICETDDEYIVEVAAPGMNKKDFKVDINNGMLEIKVEKEKEGKEEGVEYTRREYNYNAFYRALSLPDTVDPDKIEAEYEEGILKVNLPKLPEAKKKTVKEIAIS